MPTMVQVTEPHPLASPSATYSHHGRGGAGNKHSVPASYAQSAYARGPYQPPPTSALQAASKLGHSKFATGRGGAGNVLPASERAIFSFDEELERRRVREETAAPIYHVGRGGAGNVGDSRTSADGASIHSKASSRKPSADVARGCGGISDMRFPRTSGLSGERTSGSGWGRLSGSFHRA